MPIQKPIQPPYVVKFFDSLHSYALPHLADNSPEYTAGKAPEYAADIAPEYAAGNAPEYAAASDNAGSHFSHCV